MKGLMKKTKTKHTLKENLIFTSIKLGLKQTKRTNRNTTKSKLLFYVFCNSLLQHQNRAYTKRKSCHLPSMKFGLKKQQKDKQEHNKNRIQICILCTMQFYLTLQKTFFFFYKKVLSHLYKIIQKTI